MDGVNYRFEVLDDLRFDQPGPLGAHHLRQGRPRFEGGGFVFEHYYYEVTHGVFAFCLFIGFW
jgi:hypothetical protein